MNQSERSHSCNLSERNLAHFCRRLDGAQKACETPGARRSFGTKKRRWWEKQLLLLLQLLDEVELDPAKGRDLWQHILRVSWAGNLNIRLDEQKNYKWLVENWSILVSAIGFVGRWVWHHPSFSPPASKAHLRIRSRTPEALGEAIWCKCWIKKQRTFGQADAWAKLVW